MKKILHIILIISALWQNAQAQTITGAFQHGGITRNYKVYIPANYNAANAHPLVFNLHGYTSNGTAQASMCQMNVIADTAGFLVAYPEGTLDGSFQQYWNAGYGTAIDDIGFISALIDTIASNYNIDLQRVYSTGISNGAIMSSTLACELNHRIAAIAGVAGTMSWLQRASCNPINPIPVMLIHGTSDGIVPYVGNTLLMGVDTLIEFWRLHNGLTGSYSTTPIPNTNLLDGCTASYIRYEIGSNYPVHLIKVLNGGHSWPGSGVFVSGTTNMDFNASLEIWKFFSQYALTTNISSVENEAVVPVWLLGSNPVQGVLQWQTNFDKEYHLSICNFLGQELVSKSFNNTTDELDINNFPSGTYIAVFTTKNNRHSVKFVK